MGCDYSALVKQQFTQQITNLENAKKKIAKKQKNVQALLDEFSNLYVPDIDVDLIKKNLCSHLVKIENIMQEIIHIKENSLNASRSYEEILKSPQAPPLPSHSRQNSSIKKKVGANNEKSLKASVKFTTSESILEDPEILALINKNREKFKKNKKIVSK